MNNELDMVFKEVFGSDIADMPVDQVSMDTVPSWDSLNHLRLLMAVEERFDVQLSTEDFQKLISFEEVEQALKRNGKN